MVIGAIPQIEVDQGLVWNAFFVSQGFEVVDGAAIDVDGDLLFQTVCIGIFSGVQLVDIVFVSHKYHLKYRQDKLAVLVLLHVLQK